MTRVTRMTGPAEETTAPAGTGLFRGMSPARGRMIGWFWIFFWLIFLVDPVWRHAHGDSREQLGAALLALGGAVYVGVVHRALDAVISGRRLRGHLHDLLVWGGGLGVFGLMLGAAHLIGLDGFALLPYALVVLAMGLPVAQGALAAGALTLVAYALSRPLTGDPLESGLIFSALASAAASSLGAYSIGRNIAARRAQQDANLLRVQEERNRMARDLHDILGHSLTVITVKAELAGRLVDVDPEKAKVQIAELEQLSRSALADVRRTVSGYREISLAGELARARSALTDAGIRAELPGSVDDVAPDLRELFAWTVREATTNVIRHSGAKTCWITLSGNEIRITDNGHGPGSKGAGNGLSGLRERAEAAGAVLRTSTEGGGFTVVVGTADDPTHDLRGLS